MIGGLCQSNEKVPTRIGNASLFPLALNRVKTAPRQKNLGAKSTRFVSTATPETTKINPGEQAKPFTRDLRECLNTNGSRSLPQSRHSHSVSLILVKSIGPIKKRVFILRNRSAHT